MEVCLVSLEKLKGKTFGKIESEKETYSNHVFVIDRPKSIETKSILDENFHLVRPQTLLFDENETRLILVYLPTKIENESGTGENKKKQIDYGNLAYFVIKTKDEKIILPYDSEQLKENYKMNILSEWENVRWKTKDITSWLEETEPTDPKKVYELLDQTTKKIH